MVYAVIGRSRADEMHLYNALCSVKIPADLLVGKAPSYLSHTSLIHCYYNEVVTCISDC